MSKSLLAILVAIQISTQIVSESVSEIDASKISIQSRRKVIQKNLCINFLLITKHDSPTTTANTTKRYYK